MSNKAYHKVGGVFFFRGMRLKVCRMNSPSCGVCALYGKDIVSHCNGLQCSSAERPDHADVVFVETTQPLTEEKHIGENTEMINTLRQQLSVLKEAMSTYPGKTIDNIVMQMEARIKEMEKGQKT